MSKPGPLSSRRRRCHRNFRSRPIFALGVDPAGHVDRGFAAGAGAEVDSNAGFGGHREEGRRVRVSRRGLARIHEFQPHLGPEHARGGRRSGGAYYLNGALAGPFKRADFNANEQQMRIIQQCKWAILAAPAGAQGIEWKTLNDEVNSIHAAGNYDRAVVVATKALAVAKKEMGADHPSVALSLNNLALLYATQGQHAAAAGR